MPNVDLDTLFDGFEKHNLAIFPIGKDGKKPIVKWTKESTKDRHKWKEWAKTYPRCNWGIACGLSDLTVIDIDRKPSKENKPGVDGFGALEELEASLDEDYQAPRVTTPTGGLHIYFLSPTKGLRNISPFPGIDLKTKTSDNNGGFVLAPGSIIKGKSYQFVPGYSFLDIEKLEPLPDKWLSEFKRKISKDEFSDGEYKLPKWIPEGDRHNQNNLYANHLFRKGWNYPKVYKELQRVNQEHQKSKPRKIIEEVVDSSSKFIHTEEKKPRKKKDVKVFEDYKEFFENTYQDRRFCPIKKNLFVRTVYDEWETATSQDSILKSLSTENYLPHGVVPQHLDHWASRRCNHGMKEEMLVDIPEWDGKDRIVTFLGCLQVTNMSKEFAYQLLQHYLANIWRRIESPKERNWVLVLHGGQNLGKDWWIREFLGGWDTRYYYVRLNAFTDEIRTYMHLDGRIIIHMAEFDEAKKWSPGFLKDLVTKESLDYIGKYKGEITSIPSRHTLIASANRLDFLKDTSGSSRFLIFDLDEIIYEYPMNESMQVIAQSKTLFESGYRASKDALEWLDREQERVTPPDTDLLIIEEFREALELILASRAQNLGCTVENLDSMAKKVLHSDLDNVWKLLCEKYGKRRKTIIGIVKPVFGRKSMSVRYFTVQTH